MTKGSRFPGKAVLAPLAVVGSRRFGVSKGRFHRLYKGYAALALDNPIAIALRRPQDMPSSRTNPRAFAVRHERV